MASLHSLTNRFQITWDGEQPPCIPGPVYTSLHPLFHSIPKVLNNRKHPSLFCVFHVCFHLVSFQIELLGGGWGMWRQREAQRGASWGAQPKTGEGQWRPFSFYPPSSWDPFISHVLKKNVDYKGRKQLKKWDSQGLLWGSKDNL